MVLLAEPSTTKPSKTIDKSETDEAHEKSVAVLNARLDAEQKLKDKVREEERACFEETARILGHNPPSDEQVKAAARRHEMIDRIAKLGEKAGFIGEAFADDYGETRRGHFAGGQIMELPGVERLYNLNDLAGNFPLWSSTRSTVFGPPYRFKHEYPGDYLTEAVPYRGANRSSGKVFAKGSTDRPGAVLAASVGVSFSLPRNKFDGPIPRVSGPPIPPSYRTSQARIIASIAAGSKLWMFHAESMGGECRGDVRFFPIWARPIYDDQQQTDLTSEWTTTSAMHWRKRTIDPPDFSRPDPYNWYEYLGNSNWPLPTGLPSTATSPWFTVDNYHTYEIHVGVRVETMGGAWLPGVRYVDAIAEMEAVIQSITIEFTD